MDKFTDGPFPEEAETQPDGLAMPQHAPSITRDVADKQMRDSAPPAETSVRISRIEVGIGMILRKLDDVLAALRGR